MASPVRLRRLPHFIRMRITDDAKSFQVERALKLRDREHLGILGMKERLEMVGGRLSIESAPDKGTTVIAELPIGKALPADRSPRKLAGITP